MKLDAFHPTEKREQEVDYFYPGCHARGCGVYCFIVGSPNVIKFLTLESISRRIPRKEWEVPLPEFALFEYAINSHADVLVVTEQTAR